MKLSDLPEEIQMQVLKFSDTTVRSLEGQPVEILDLLDKAVVAGMELEAGRHNSQAENLWQVLAAFRNMVACSFDNPNPNVVSTLSLVDQCLIENKPQTLVP